MSDTVNEEDAPVSILATTDSGRKYDLNNISSKKKAELIMEGEMGYEDFVSPPNMPGKKLAEMRNKFKSNISGGIKAIAGDEKNEFKVGDAVKFKKDVTLVLEIDPDRGVLIRKSNGKKVWVHHTKVKAVESE